MKTVHQAANLLTFVFSAFVLACFCACQTGPSAGTAAPQGNEQPPATIVLREGDNVKIDFPSSPKLNTQQLIRRDGQIVIPTLGEIHAAGRTPTELEKDILAQYGTNLVTKEVSVTLDSSQFPYFVSGAVGHGGKFESARPVTVLEAIMEAGGPNYATANLKAVKVIRTEGSAVKTFILDLRGLLKGQASTPFYVQPSDIIYVPERFTLF